MRKELFARVKDEIFQFKRVTPFGPEAIDEIFKYKDYYLKYRSRRLQDYDDSDSDGCLKDCKKEWAQIEYFDSEGVKYRIPENPKLTKYAPVFQNLLI